MDSAIPECPITKLPLEDPVMDPEGNTYEKSAILAWLQQHGTSPITRSPLSPEQLVPNRALKDLIESRKDSTQFGIGAAREASNVIAGEQVATTAITASQIRLETSPIHSGQLTAFTIKGPSSANDQPFPVHICCVIDVSGSMGDLASIKGQEASGLCILDIVKHAVKTIIQSLSAGDMLSIIAFSDGSNVVLKPSLMNDKGKTKAEQALGTLSPDGGTNLAAGYNHGVQVSSQVDKAFFNSIFVLTDGVPSDPSLDFVGMLSRKMDKNPIFGNLNTFGFAYNLNSQLLQNLAFQGNGSFNFIPDAGFVGTVFINALANVRTVYAVNAALVINDPNTEVFGKFSVSKTGEATIVKLPPLRVGQSNTIVVKGSKVSGSVSCQVLYGEIVSVSCIETVMSEELQFYHEKRVRVSTALFDSAADARLFDDKNSTKLANFRKEFTLDEEFESLRSKLSAIDGLAKDVEGQVTEALSKSEYFSRWGCHYMISLGFAHLKESCNNFKDPGVQVYGGSLFKKMQDQMNDMFITLPPPQPAALYTMQSSYRGSVGSAPVQMTMFLDSNGVCFHSSSLVDLYDGSQVAVRNLCRGMMLKSAAIVECIVETIITDGCHFVRMGETGNLLITPYHPVKIAGEWKFPLEIKNAEYHSTNSVFSIVTKDRSTVSIDEIECATLGHGISNDPVASHEYFGTDAVIKDLKQIHSYHSGKIVLQSKQIIRNAETGRIDSILSVIPCQ